AASAAPRRTPPWNGRGPDGRGRTRSCRTHTCVHGRGLAAKTLPMHATARCRYANSWGVRDGRLGGAAAASTAQQSLHVAGTRPAHTGAPTPNASTPLSYNLAQYKPATLADSCRPRKAPTCPPPSALDPCCACWLCLVV